jgi:cell division protein FtsW
MFHPFAVTIHGSHRWLRLGFLTFQPSELLKIGLLLYVAYFLQKQTNKSSHAFFSYIPLFFWILLSFILLLKQPDFGLAVTLAITIFLLLYIMRVKAKYLLYVALIALPAAAALVFFKEYRFKRIMTFFDPWSDPQGAGFQIIQSLIAIGSGSWSGIGVSHSKQKFFYLPMQHTDFIFSIIAEETGFIGVSFLILLYFLLLYIGIRLAWKMQDLYAAVLTLGFVLLTSLQAMINLAVATGLVPTKGIGLPFVSYGNSALICSLAMLGIIMNCVYENRAY